MKRIANSWAAAPLTGRLAALAVLVALTAGAAPTAAQGFCDSRAYIVGGDGVTSTVYRIEFDGTTLEFVPVVALDFDFNAFDVNPTDGLLYGSAFVAGTLQRVDPSGTATNITPPGWDTSVRSYGSGITPDGATWTLIKVDPANGNARQFCNVDITVGPPFTFSCVAAQPNAIMTDGAWAGLDFYTVGGATGRLRRVDPASGAGTDIRDDFPPSSPGGYGSLFAGPEDLFTYGNATGALLHLDADKGYAWSVLTDSGPVAANTDGGACNFEGFCGPDLDGDGVGDFCESDLGDLVWYDTNQDGVQSAGEPGIAGATIALHASPDCSGPAGWSTMSDGAGGWTIDTVPPSPNATTESYCLDFTLPAGIAWIWSPRQAGGDPDLDSNVDANGQQPGLRVFSFDDPTRDGGAFANGQISGQVYCDENGSGSPDPGEGIAGVALALAADADCDGPTPSDPLVRTATSDPEGDYAYAPDLPAGPPGGPALCYQTTLDEATLPATCSTVVLAPPPCELTADEAACEEAIVVEPPVPVTLQGFAVE